VGHFEDETSALDPTDVLTTQRAHHLILHGRLPEAERALTRHTESTQSVAGLDLLARIAVQNGELKRADSLWQSVLQINPDNTVAQAALWRRSRRFSVSENRFVGG